MQKNIFLVWAFILILISTVSAQTKNKQKFAKEKIETDSLGIPLNGMQFYFPISMFVTTGSRNLKLSKYLDRWYSGMLFALREPLLYQSMQNKETYRFTWLRRFRHPVSVRIENDKGKIFLFVKVTDGAGGSYPGNLITNQTKELNQEDWNVFKTKISKLDFWNQPVEETKELDGENSEWILEGGTKDSYHFISRTSPVAMNQKLFRECCQFLVKLAGIENSEVKK